MILLLLAVSAFIFFSNYFFLTRPVPSNFHQKIILAGLWSFGQVILTELFLGIIKVLYLPDLIFLNLGIATILLTLGIWGRDGGALWLQECRTIREGIKSVMAWENIFLLVLAGFVLIWMVTAICFFPPRNGDELSYHLPPILQYIIDHKIYLLPVEVNKRFAFPENAELLFMWPAIVLHSQQLVNSVQLIVAFWGTAVMYGLGRILGLGSKISLFVSLLFLLTPVVLSQMGCCYIDVIIAVFFLTVVYAAGVFYKTGRLLYFYSTALAAGLLWGMKYNEAIFILSVLPFLCSRPVTLKRWFGFIIIFIIAGGFWYLRNLWALKTPIYPVPFSQDSLGIFTEHAQNVDLWRFMKVIPHKLFLNWKDIGLGTLHGGYGLIFWSLAFPAWLLVWVRSMARRNWFDFWVYSLLVLGLGQLLVVPLQDYSWTSRYSIFMVALGLLALGQAMMIFDKKVFFSRAIRISCILFAVLAVVNLSNNDPSYRIDGPIKALINRNYFLQVKLDPDSFTALGVVDYLTLDDAKPLYCAISTLNHPTFDMVNSTLYGTKLQNRSWILEHDRPLMPDVLLFLRSKEKEQGNSDSDLPAILKEIRVINLEYFLIERSSQAYLFIHKDFFKDPQKQHLLYNFLKK